MTVSLKLIASVSLFLFILLIRVECDVVEDVPVKAGVELIDEKIDRRRDREDSRDRRYFKSRRYYSNMTNATASTTENPAQTTIPSKETAIGGSKQSRKGKESGKRCKSKSSKTKCRKCPETRDCSSIRSTLCNCPEIPPTCAVLATALPKLSQKTPYQGSEYEYGAVIKEDHEFICGGDESSRISEAEAEQIEKFQNDVQSQIWETSLLHNYSEDTSYVLRWIRGFNSSEYDPEDIEEFFLEHADLREYAQIDRIHREDWAEIAENFPLSHDANDKDGRPLAEVHLNEWDIEKSLLKETKEKLVRWWIRLMEVLTRQLNLIEDADDCYKQAMMIVDIGQFNRRKHACASCRSFYYEIMSLMDVNYPNLFYKIIFVNANSVFVDNILSVIHDAVTPETYSKVEVYIEREDWCPILEELIDPEERSDRFCGKKLSRHGAKYYVER